jgi:uncharacterized membrane protein YsdA (DUF1294 family)
MLVIIDRRHHQRLHLSTMKHKRSRSIDGIKNPSYRSPHYCRSYVRFRTNSLRSRSHSHSRSRSHSCDYSKHFQLCSSIDYRERCILLAVQTMAFVHFCSIVYFHQQQSGITVKYMLITFILLNVLAYTCIRYDTCQVEHGRLLFGERPILLLFWYGGLIGGSLALILEKHQHLRSQAFTIRLRLLCIVNGMWPGIIYIVYMCRKDLPLIDVLQTCIISRFFSM